jgi:Condensation domain/Phosphopantetheine attachment site
VDRERLPAPALERAAEREAEGEWTPVEELVAGIWSEVLKLEVVRRGESFFELGGHSLLATQVISRVREVFRVEVGLRRLFEEPTLQGFSGSIEAELRAGAGVTVPALQRLGDEEREQWGGVLPLSFAQQRLWFLNQLEPGSSFYNSFKAVRLKGALQIEALEQTLSEIMRRHEVLRTRFVSIGGEPRQEVLPAEEVKLAVTDFSELEETDREAAVREAATAERREPFDLAQGPMLRVKLLRLSDEEHVVLLTMHHIVSDGWSLGVLIKEVATLYEAYSKGHESPLTELPIQYSDFALWQRGWLQGEELERQLAYWRKQLGGVLPVLELPTDRVRPAVPSYRGAQLSFRLSPEVSAGLKELSRREGVTLFMTLLAAFQTLLHRYSGQEEILVGTAIANRNYRETEELIGFFINQLVLRTNLSGEPTFLELLQRVKEVCLGAYAHQDVPFEKLVEELQPERDLSRSPIIQVHIGFQKGVRQTGTVANTHFSPLPNEGTQARFDLTLWITDLGQQLVLTWTFSTDLFHPETVTDMHHSYETLLQDLLAAPTKTIKHLTLVSQKQKEHEVARDTKLFEENRERFRAVKPRAQTLQI